MKRKTTFRIRFFVIIALAIAFVIAIVLHFTDNNKDANTTELIRVEISRIARGEETTRFTFYGEQGLWTEWYAPAYIPLDNTGIWLSAEDGAMQQSHVLSAEKWEQLQSALEESKFRKWDRDYIGVSDDMDTAIYSITFTFADGKEKEVDFTGRFPDNLQLLRNALYGITGSDVLP